MSVLFRSVLAGLVVMAMLTPARAEAPARPGKVRSEKLSERQVYLTWRDRADNEQVYLVQRRRVDRSRFLTRAVLPANVTEYVDRVPARSIFVYRVVARNAEGETTPSAKCFVNHTPPPTPTNIHVRLIALTTAEITWADRSFTERGFRIERRAEGMPTFEVVGRVRRGSELFIDRTLDSATTYTYRVVALGKPARCIAHSRPSRARTVTSKGGVRVLEVEVKGSGSGYVVSIPEGINCGPQRRHCSAEFPLGEYVRLIPTPNGDSVFNRWNGDPLCEDEPDVCLLRMGKDRDIVARFRDPR